MHNLVQYADQFIRDEIRERALPINVMIGRISDGVPVLGVKHVFNDDKLKTLAYEVEKGNIVRYVPKKHAQQQVYTHRRNIE